MWKKFLHGFLFGAGFFVGVVLLGTVWVKWIMPTIFSSRTATMESAKGITTEAPEIVERKKFLGSTGSYSGDFRIHELSVLAPGEAAIQGTAFAEGKPATGLRVRLMLNGSVASQWGEVDESGTYRIPVPSGRYRIDGHEIDKSTADLVLPELIGAPSSHLRQQEFSLASGESGQVSALHYIRPVVIVAPTGETHITPETVIRWQPYLGASKYRVQIEEARTFSNIGKVNYLFSWESRPVTSSPEFKLGEHVARIHPGKLYNVHIQAIADDGRVISESAVEFGKHHFKAI